jgi:hypothetical protein
LAFESDSGVGDCFLIATEPSIPTVVLRNNATPDETLGGLAKVELVA